MAKKKETSLSYLQLPLPESGKYYKMTKRSWCGLNYRQTIDTGALSAEKNISAYNAPYLTPSQSRDILNSKEKYSKPIDIFGFDNFLLVIYRISTKLYIDYLTVDEDGYIENTYTGVLKSSGATSDDEYPRSVVQFNVYDTPTDPIEGKYIKKLLIFPDKKSMDFEITEDGFEISDMTVLIKEYYNETKEKDGTYPPPDGSSHNYYYKNTYNQEVYRWVDDDSDSDNSGWRVRVPPAMPDIKYAAVHLSRLFGVDDTRVYASGYNDYTNWNLDTADEYNESNAWCSPAQSNVKADGAFSGITTFQNHVICFKDDFMHEIYNNKNPFRVQDIYSEGTIDQRSVCDVDGRLIFASKDGVKLYTGSNPRIISYNLNIDEFSEAVAGSDGRRYLLYCKPKIGKRRFFVYDTYTEEWSEESVDSAVLNFAHIKNGMYMLLKDGYIYKTDTGYYDCAWSFETDLITNNTVDIKHIKKIQMLADIAVNAEIKVYILYDDEKFNENTSHLVYKNKKCGQVPIRVKPRNTASYGIKLHVEGLGYVKLYELELLIENGGDLYV